MIYGVTGHRDVEQEPGELLAFARLTVAKMVERGCSEIITGMARGWDLKVARSAAEHGVPFIAAVPFPQQASLWNGSDQTEWQWAMSRAKDVVVSYPFATNDAYHKRNRLIVDNCVELWSFWNGSPGGTRSCTLYAGEVGRTVRPLWEPWTRFRAERN